MRHRTKGWGWLFRERMAVLLVVLLALFIVHPFLFRMRLVFTYLGDRPVWTLRSLAHIPE